LREEVCRNFCEGPSGKRPIVKLSWSREDNIKVGFKDVVSLVVDRWNCFRIMNRFGHLGVSNSEYSAAGVQLGS
jgi:hypothetical protein